MPTIKAIFVSEDGLIHEIIGEVVRKVTKGKYAHAAIGLNLYGDDYILEAVGSHVGLSPGNKYYGAKVLKVLEIPVTEEQLLLIQKEALRITASVLDYGLLTDCIAGGLADVLGDKVGEAVADVICGDDSMDCSRLQTHIIRIAYPSYAEGMSDHIITPEDGDRLCCGLLGIPYEKEVKENE